MAYSAITSGEIDPDSPFTTSLATKFRDNPEAIADDDTGATDIQWSAIINVAIDAADINANAVGQSEIAAAAVGQGELKTTTASGSQLVSSLESAAYTLTGGTYSLWQASGSVTNTDGFSFGHGNQAAGVLGVYNHDSGAQRTFYIDERYVQASPPYRLDDIVPAFIYALIDNNTGEILATRAALDPPWAYHGQTNIAAKFIDRQGRAWRMEKAWKVDLYQGRGPNPYALLRSGQLSQAADIFSNNSLVPLQITNDIKNRDMNWYPHPFPGVGLTGKTVIMLDPASTFCIDLMEIIIDGGSREIVRMLENQDIRFNTEPLSRTGPPGVVCVSPRWR